MRLHTPNSSHQTTVLIITQINNSELVIIFKCSEIIYPGRRMNGRLVGQLMPWFGCDLRMIDRYRLRVSCVQKHKVCCRSIDVGGLHEQALMILKNLHINYLELFTMTSRSGADSRLDRTNLCSSKKLLTYFCRKKSTLTFWIFLGTLWNFMY